MKRNFIEAPGPRAWGTRPPQSKDKPVEGLYLTFFLGHRLLVWPHLFLEQLTAGECKSITLVADLVAVVFLGELAEGRPNMLLTEKAPCGGLFLDIGYCILTEYSHSPAVCLRKSDAVGQAGCPPCLGFWF